MKITFQANINNQIDSKYKTPQSKENTVAVLGSSKDTNYISKYMEMCANITKALVLRNNNIVHGCGSKGIMGAAYDSGYKYSSMDENGLPEQNLAILKNPLYGDENTKHCTVIGCANSEADRIEMFSQVADTIVIFPGSAGTLQEATTLISKNYYGKQEDKKKIILVGKDFFNGLIEQYNKLYETGLIDCPYSKLFSVVDNEEELSCKLHEAQQ